MIKGEQIMEYVIVGAIVGAFIGAISVWAKKTNKRQAERMKMLSQEQLDYLENAGFSACDDKGKLRKTIAVLTNIKEGTSSYASVDYIFYNVCTKRHELGDGKIARNVLESRGLKVGDYIEVVFKFKNDIIESFKEII